MADLQAIRAHALEQRETCRNNTHDPHDPLVALWTAIADAATALAPDFHPAIRKGRPKWTQPALFP